MKKQIAILILFILSSGIDAKERFCVDHAKSSVGFLRLLQLKENRLFFCVNDSYISYPDLPPEQSGIKNLCFETDLRSRNVEIKEVPPPFKEKNRYTLPYFLEDDPPVIEQKDRIMEICFARKDCVKIFYKNVGDQTFTPGMIKRNGARDLLMIDYGQQDIVYDIYELPGGKHLKRMMLADFIKKTGYRPMEELDFPVYTVLENRIIGHTVFSLSSPCTRSCDRALLLNYKSEKMISWIGGESEHSFFAAGVNPRHVKGDLWAFNEGTGLKIVIQNVRTGEIVHTVDLTSELLGFLPKDDDGWPRWNINYMFKYEGDLLLLLGGKEFGTVFRINPNTYKTMSVMRLPECKKGSH